MWNVWKVENVKETFYIYKKSATWNPRENSNPKIVWDIENEWRFFPETHYPKVLSNFAYSRFFLRQTLKFFVILGSECPIFATKILTVSGSVQLTIQWTLYELILPTGFFCVLNFSAQKRLCSLEGCTKWLKKFTVSANLITTSSSYFFSISIKILIFSYYVICKNIMRF